MAASAGDPELTPDDVFRPIELVVALEFLFPVIRRHVLCHHQKHYVEEGCVVAQRFLSSSRGNLESAGEEWHVYQCTGVKRSTMAPKVMRASFRSCPISSKATSNTEDSGLRCTL